jgi:hypothetical protein
MIRRRGSIAVPNSAQTQCSAGDVSLLKVLMIKVSHSLAIALLISATGAQAKEIPRSTMKSMSSAEQEAFYNRVQHTNTLSSRSICAGNCAGSMRARSQPSNPFAKLPDVHDVPPPVLQKIDQ